ncbi:MAG TPA: YnfA family protein [Panacibacter sp.]|nr:YnfA family protein [Panacibacter sp.]
MVLKSIVTFLLAGLCEIGGGYLVWLWLKEDKPFWYGLAGGIILAFYGIIATLQTASFGRTYATYGGYFIILSLLWAYKFDNFRPDRYDIIGASVALAGVCIMFYARRN